jgi:hypothetical protein
MTTKIIQFLGSIKLAVPLLGLIAVVLVGATFYESEVGAAVVQQEIYKSPWFGALMLLLAINLGVSTLLRYPWQGARKIGFALAHWGLIVIIAGSAAVIHLSVEGLLLARTDAGPVSTLRVEGDLLEVVAPGQPSRQTDLFIKPGGSVVPRKIGDLTLLGYSNNTVRTVQFGEGAAIENPAVRLVLSSTRMGQTLERWLAAAPSAYNQIDIGPAELQIVQVHSPQALESALSSPDVPEVDRWGSLQLTWAGETRQLTVQPSLGKTIRIGSAEITVTGFWPDFRLDGNRQPATVSQQLRNPAVQLDMRDGVNQERWFIFGNQTFEPIRTQLAGAPLPVSIAYTVPTTDADAFFRVVVDAQGHLFYAARSSQGLQSGPLSVGDTITPGWADFKITLADYLPQAQVHRQIVPLPETAAPDAGEPALLVALPTGDPTWIPWGEPTALAEGWYVAFSPKLLPLPFAVQLDDFIVERNEGSESVAMWTSAVTLQDPHTGERVQRRVWMNHPTWFKGWKLAQASWNPGDLSQSTLQVKREPWWVTALTWSGSLMVTAGIATMFYGRAVSKQLKTVSDLVTAPDPEASTLERGTPVQVVEG